MTPELASAIQALLDSIVDDNANHGDILSRATIYKAAEVQRLLNSEKAKGKTDHENRT